jgi:hypothetical protein
MTVAEEKLDVVMAESTQGDTEKGTTVHVIDNFRVLGLTNDDADFYNAFSEERRRRIVRKVDMRLVPMLAILYLISHLDRANIGNAKIEGLAEDLGCKLMTRRCGDSEDTTDCLLVDNIQWNIILSLFFVPYILLGKGTVAVPFCSSEANRDAPPLRDSQQHVAQKAWEAVHLHWHSRHVMGYHHDAPRRC